MTPSLSELLQGATRWNLAHKQVSILLSHHMHRTGEEYPGAEPHPGIWCYYLLIPEQMFPHRWAEFACIRKENGFTEPGPAWKHEWFASEITWSSSEPYFDRKTARQFDLVKVGCDYGHLWHMERDYPDTFTSVKADACRTVDLLIEANPDRLFRSAWSGVWGPREEFYTSRNGQLVHCSDTILADHPGWQKQEGEAP